jgi:hypothetical protein
VSIISVPAKTFWGISLHNVLKTFYTPLLFRGPVSFVKVRHGCIKTGPDLAHQYYDITSAKIKIQIKMKRFKPVLFLSNPRHATRDTQHATRDTRHATHDTRHATRDTRHATHDTRHATRDTRHTTRDTRHATRDTRHATRDTRHTTRGRSDPCLIQTINNSRTRSVVFKAKALPTRRVANIGSRPPPPRVLKSSLTLLLLPTNQHLAIRFPRV